ATLSSNSSHADCRPERLVRCRLVLPSMLMIHLLILAIHLLATIAKLLQNRAFIARWTRMPHSTGRLIASASSHHSLSSAAFITNIAESDFRHAQLKRLGFRLYPQQNVNSRFIITGAVWAQRARCNISSLFFDSASSTDMI